MSWLKLWGDASSGVHSNSGTPNKYLKSSTHKA